MLLLLAALGGVAGEHNRHHDRRHEAHHVGAYHYSEKGWLAESRVGDPAVAAVGARTGHWVDFLYFELRNGTTLNYTNDVDIGAGMGGHKVGPWFFEDDEIIVEVKQLIRENFYAAYLGLGDSIQLITAIGGRNSRVIEISGNHVGDLWRETSYRAPAGHQIIGLRFDDEAISDAIYEQFLEGCSMRETFSERHMSASILKDLNFTHCPARLVVGESCKVKCSGGPRKAYAVSKFTCLAAGEPPDGLLPGCHGRHVGFPAAAILTVAAAVAVAVGGAFGGNKSFGIVGGPHSPSAGSVAAAAIAAAAAAAAAEAASKGTQVPRLSMEGVWQDTATATTYLIEHTDNANGRRQKAADTTAGASRRILKLVFDLPITAEERNLVVQMVAPTSVGWQPVEGSQASISLFSSVGGAERSASHWFRGQLLWVAEDRSSLERISQHTIRWAAPGRAVRIMKRQKIASVRFWNFLYPTVMVFFGALCLLLRIDGFPAAALFICGAALHMQGLRTGRHECRVPASLPQFGSVSAILVVAGMKTTLGDLHWAEQWHELLGAVTLMALFAVSAHGNRCVADSSHAVLLLLACATVGAYLLMPLLVFPMIFRFVKHRHLLDVATAVCITSGMLHLAAAKIWGNRHDAAFSGAPSETAIELRSELAPAASLRVGSGANYNSRESPRHSLPTVSQLSVREVHLSNSESSYARRPSAQALLRPGLETVSGTAPATGPLVSDGGAAESGGGGGLQQDAIILAAAAAREPKGNAAVSESAGSRHLPQEKHDF